MQESPLSKFLQEISPMSEGLKQYLSSHTTFYCFARGDQMPYIPPISHTVYFVEYGLVAGTKSLPEGKVTLWFSDEEHFILPGLLSAGHSFTERLEFLAPTEMVGIEMQTVLNAISLFPELKLMCLTILDRHMRELYQREYLLRLPSDLRYKMAFSQHPQYFTESTNDHLASYLNLSKRHFTRLKKEFHHSKLAL